MSGTFQDGQEAFNALARKTFSNMSDSQGTLFSGQGQALATAMIAIGINNLALAISTKRFHP